MSLICVSYDLALSGKQAYDGIDEVMSEFPDKCRVLQSVWLVRTDLSAQAVREEFSPIFGRGDRLFVFEVDENGFWSSTGLSANVNNWLHAQSVV
jgi:hypothetical protein